LASTIKHQDNLAFEKNRLLKTWPIHHRETNQHNGIPTQASKFHEDSPHVSLLKPYRASTIPRKTHEPPPPIIIEGD